MNDSFGDENDDFIELIVAWTKSLSKYGIASPVPNLLFTRLQRLEAIDFEGAHGLKVVIFAGGLGTRMREETDFRPKPMVEIGGKPVLWHLMKHFSTYGHTEFVILAGYKAYAIKEYFANFHLHNSDVTVSSGSGEISYIGRQPEDWTVTVLDTGEDTLTGERLLRAKDAIGPGDFLCTYGDGLAPVDLQVLTQQHSKSMQVGTMTVVRPSNRFGVVEFGVDKRARHFREKPQMDNWVNMGFFCFSEAVFSYLRSGESLEEGALVRMTNSGVLSVNEYDGFWEPMDTYREYQALNHLWKGGAAPWKTWK